MVPEPDASHTTTFDDDERPSEVVITAVAALTDRPPLELSPLYDRIDPDALDALFSHAKETPDPGSYRLQFTYEGYDVVVRGDGRITFIDRPEPIA